MDLPNRRPNRLSGFDYSTPSTYFVTICTRDRKALLSRITAGIPLPGSPREICPKTELSKYGMIADKYIRQLDAFYEYISIDRYVIMPDHIHMLITLHAPSRSPGKVESTRTSIIARFVGTFKRFCNKEYGENIWQARFHDHVIRNQQDYDETWRYIDDNPRRWWIKERGYE